MQLVGQEEDISFYCREYGLPADESSVPQLPNCESTRISAIDKDPTSAVHSQPAEPESTTTTVQLHVQTKTSHHLPFQKKLLLCT
jgi:hypothetical protein